MHRARGPASTGRGRCPGYHVGCSSPSATTATTSTRPMQFRPCIDLHKGKVKQIVGSTLSDLEKGGNAKELLTNFVASESPSHYAELYSSDGLYGGHMILLSKDAETQRVAREALRDFPNTLQVGGGVDARNAGSYLDDGASHVIVTSSVFKNGELQLDRLETLSSVVGRERLVLDLSCRRREAGGDYYVVTDRWQKFASLKVDQDSLAHLSEYCCEFLIHGVDVEGKQLGIDEDLVRLLGDYSPIPATYAGGVRTLQDMELIKGLGRGMVDATVGSALDIFGGTLPYKEVVNWHRNEQVGAGRTS